MRLSIVIPSNRDGLAAYARIMGACSWASDEVEVIVRDNSGSARKREALALVQHDNCRILHFELCDEYTNFKESLALARGEFVLFMADDDLAFDRGVQAAVDMIGRVRSDSSVVGVNGVYALEETRRSHLVRYAKLDSGSAAERVDGYLGYRGPNVIFYSAIRRELARIGWSFLFLHPIRLPFQDQLLPLIYLMAGKFAQIDRLFVINDNANWESREPAERKDLQFYERAGLDPATRELQWLLCAFEGASLALTSCFGAATPPAERQALANRWFAVMSRRAVFSTHPTAHTAAAVALREKWLGQTAALSMEDLLTDIGQFLARFAPDKAGAYVDFWRSAPAWPLP